MSKAQKMWVGDDGFLYQNEDAIEAGENAQPVTVLPHGDDGSVGPFEAWMAIWMTTGDKSLLPKPQRSWTGADLDHAIAAAIAAVLGGEAEDGQD